MIRVDNIKIDTENENDRLQPAGKPGRRQPPRLARSRQAWHPLGLHRDRPPRNGPPGRAPGRSEEHTSELQSLMRISYAVFCSKKKTQTYHPSVITNNKT